MRPHDYCCSDKRHNATTSPVESPIFRSTARQQQEKWLCLQYVKFGNSRDRFRSQKNRGGPHPPEIGFCRSAAPHAWRRRASRPGGRWRREPDASSFGAAPPLDNTSSFRAASSFDDASSFRAAASLDDPSSFRTAASLDDASPLRAAPSFDDASSFRAASPFWRRLILPSRLTLLRRLILPSRPILR